MPNRDISEVNTRDYSYSRPVENNDGSGAPKQRTTSSVSSQDWRDSNDYRKQYFNRNSGIAGKMYICSQCFKPMFDKKKIQVDHIIPPSRLVFGQTKFGQSLARLMNKSFNCAAICPECNRRKSDKMGGLIVRGYAMKSLEVTANIISMAVTAPIAILAYSLYGAGKLFKMTRR